MDDLQVEPSRHSSVWNTAIIAVAIFVAIVFFVSLFGSAEGVAVASSQ